MDVQPEAKQTDDSNSAQSPAARRAQFRLIHMVYVVTLLCTAVAAFGMVGLFLGIAAAIFWSYVFLSTDRPTALAKACIVAIMVGCLCGLLTPPSIRAREAVLRMSCMNNMKQIALALCNYHTTYKSFPPAFIPDKNGNRMHSWRVLILPFLPILGDTALYNQYDFAEPWNGPNNRKLAASVPPVYVCPSAPRSGTRSYNVTDYVAVVGPETAWPGDKRLKESTIRDEASSTILVLEAPGFATNWMEPSDPSLEEAIRLLNSPDTATATLHGDEDLLFTYSGGCSVAFADGQVRFLKHGLPEETWRAMFTTNGGEEWSDADVEPLLTAETRRLKIGKFISLVAFLLLLVLPSPWVWLNSGSSQKHEGADADVLNENKQSSPIGHRVARAAACHKGRSVMLADTSSYPPRCRLESDVSGSFHHNGAVLRRVQRVE